MHRTVIRLWATLLSLCLASCTAQEEPLRVAIYGRFGYDLFHVADRHGLLDHARTAIVETSGSTESRGMIAAGTVDAATLTLDEVIRARIGGMDLRVVYVIDTSNGADALIARPGIRALEELKAKRIGIESGVVGEVLLQAALASVDLRRDEVIVVPLKQVQGIDLAENNLDAVVTFEPTTTLLEHEGNHRLFDSSRIPGSIIDVLAVRADRLEQKRVGVRAAISALAAGRSALLSSPDESRAVIAEKRGIDFGIVQSAFRRMVLPDQFMNRQLLGGDSSGLVAACNALVPTMREGQTGSGDPDCAALFDPGFLP